MWTENLGSGHKQTESCSGEPATPKTSFPLISEAHCLDEMLCVAVRAVECFSTTKQ